MSKLLSNNKNKAFDDYTILVRGYSNYKLGLSMSEYALKKISQSEDIDDINTDDILSGCDLIYYLLKDKLENYIFVYTLYKGDSLISSEKMIYRKEQIGYLKEDIKNFTRLFSTKQHCITTFDKKYGSQDTYEFLREGLIIKNDE